MQLIRRLKENRDSDTYPFHMPGHKRRLANDELLERIYGIDITEIDGFDDLHDANGILKEAKERAAKCYGADETHFLVNGSTGGILAAIYASVTENDSIVIAANSHRSVYNAVMLSGAKPYVITPEKEAYFDIFGGISAEEVSKALDEIKEKAGENGNRTAVVITSPTYEGITSDIKAIARVCHENDAVLIVDSAHGAHLGLSEDFPESAISSGADVVVVSVHKTLPAMTQTALIHINKNCPGKERIKKMLSVFMSSSPSYVLMASVDSLTELLNERRDELFKSLSSRLDEFYQKAEKLNALSVLSADKLTASGSKDHDKSRIVVSDRTGTYTGPELQKELLDEYGICAEMAGDSYVTFITSVADTEDGFLRLINALSQIDGKIFDAQPLTTVRTVAGKLYDRLIGRRIAKRLVRVPAKVGPETKNKITSYDNNIKKSLFDEKTELIPVELAEGRSAKNFITVYPPGIPVTVPGQLITGEAVDELLAAREKGRRITGLENGEIEVTWERSST